MKSVISSLLPKEDAPIQLIIDHGTILVEISDVMEELITAYFDQKDISNLVTFISEKESEADTIKFKLRTLLDKHVKVPFPKTALLQAIHVQDDIIDMMEDLAKKMAMNYIEFKLSKSVRRDFIHLVQEVRKILGCLEDAINELKYVMASAFSKREQQKEEKGIVKIEELESQIDELTLKLGKWTYSKKNKYNTLDLIFFNDLVQIFSKIADKAENLAELLRSFTH